MRTFEAMIAYDKKFIGLPFCKEKRRENRSATKKSYKCNRCNYINYLI